MVQDRLKWRVFSFITSKLRVLQPNSYDVIIFQAKQTKNQTIHLPVLITDLFNDTVPTTETICHRQYRLKWIDEVKNRRLGK